MHAYPHLSTYTEALQSLGQLTFTASEAKTAVKTTPAGFVKAAQRLARKGKLISPRRGFFVIVPPQFHRWGAPPPSWYVDALMRYENRPYYVGLLKAAEYHGATHQAVMRYQVVTDKQLPTRRWGRSVLAFYFRKDMALIQAGLMKKNTQTGQVVISGPELTALDLVRYPHACGGFSAVITVLESFDTKLDPAKLECLLPAFERNVSQRLGYLLDWIGQDVLAQSIFSWLTNRGDLPWIELMAPSSIPQIAALNPVIERNRKWRMIVRDRLESDE
ncbi:MAG TPA: type IV toxin-antitoxin system AbiEi family antitoxin [Wenzhouxiangella sp.]